jgi:uncharacterized membrane protein
MNDLTHSRTPVRVFGATAFSFAGHLFGTLTCASCWAIFAPSLALLFGSSGTAMLAAFRPYAPFTLFVSAAGLTYSTYLLVRKRHESNKLPFRLAAAFTGLSIAGWFFSAAYVAVTLARG